MCEADIGIGDGDAELPLDEINDLEDASGVDDARGHERRVVE